VIPLYVRSEKPVKVADRPKNVKLDTLANELLASARKDGNTFDIPKAREALDKFRRGWEASGADLKQERPRHEWWFDEGRANTNEKNFAALVQSLGYDSVEYYETIGGYRGMPERRIRTVGLFDSNQLKSSSDNDGNFSRDSGDITKSADNCGTGAGGFQEDNDCAVGHGAQSADGINQEQKDEDLSVDDRLEAHLRNAGNIENFAEKLANGELTEDDFYDTIGYFAEQRDRAYEAGDDDEGAQWEQFETDLYDAMAMRDLLDENAEPQNIPSKSEPWPEERREVPDFTKVPEALENRSRHLVNTFEAGVQGDDTAEESDFFTIHEFAERRDIKQAVEGRKATIHIDTKDLKDVLFDEAFLPFGHPDVPVSTNANTSHREKIENRMGLAGAEWHQRPVYGALEAPTWVDDFDGHGSAGSFGNIMVTLKDDVLERSSITFGDSGERLSAKDAGWRGDDKTDSYPVPIPYKRIMAGEATLDEKIAAHSRDHVYEWATGGTEGYSWTEVQIWGGVSVDDIESVTMSPNAVEQDKGNRLLNMLEERGITVYRSNNNWKGE
jgi:hypothetical protein